MKILLILLLLTSPSFAMECDVAEGAKHMHVEFSVKEFTEPMEAEYWKLIVSGMIVKEHDKDIWRVLWIDGVSLPAGLVLTNCSLGMEQG